MRAAPPEPTRIAGIDEPWIKATLYVPDEYLGPVGFDIDRASATLDLATLEAFSLPLDTLKAA